MCTFAHGADGNGRGHRDFASGSNRRRVRTNPGFVDKVLVTPGTAIKKGDVIVQLKSVEAEAQKALAGVPSSPEMRQAIDSVKGVQASTRTSSDDLQSVAPFDGVVTQVSVEPGSLAGPSLGPMAHIENQDTLRLSVTMPEKQAPEVSQGAKVPFTVSSLPGRAFTAVVTRITRSALAQLAGAGAKTARRKRRETALDFRPFASICG